VLLWFLLYKFVLDPSGRLDLWLIDRIKAQSEWLLQFLGYQLLPESSNVEGDRYIGIQGGHYLWIGNSCNGLSIFAYFSAFILAFPGSWKHKLWFMPLGILLIHGVNVIRVAALCIVVKVDPDLLSLNHDAIFYIVVYSFVIGLWFWWVKQYGNLKAELRDET